MCLISHQPHYEHRHHTHEIKRYLSQKVDGNKDPVPFLSSQARKFKVDDAYRVDPAARRKQRYAIPLGFGLFGVIMYFGFFRKYGKVDSSVMDFLTKDISSRLPEDVRQRIPADVVQNQGTSRDQKLNPPDKTN